MLFLILVAALTGKTEVTASPGGHGLGGASDSLVQKVPFQPSQWELVWADEFENNGPPDSANWTHETGYIRNRESQYYTDDLRNCRVEDGRLLIEARRDPAYERGYSSASVTTFGKREYHLGRLEARAKVPTGLGTWSAIWTLGVNRKEADWPMCGELDILENVGFDPMTLHANVHTGTYNHTRGNGRGKKITASNKPWEHFNLYAVEWYQDRMEFFFNDIRYLVVHRRPGDDRAAWPFDEPQYLILNLAIGGAWGGQKGIDKKRFPHRFEIDYVRYYRRKD